MTPDFPRAVVDTVLPEGVAALPGGPALPSGSAAGIDLAGCPGASQAVLDAIAAAAGGAAEFARLPETARVEFLRRVEHDRPEAFRAFIVRLLADYYESTAVLVALGWSSEPPQPLGHDLPPTDGETQRRLERVRARGALWRS